MKLPTADKWLQKCFDDTSRPGVATLQRWLRDRKIPGKRVSGTWFIDEDEWLADGDLLVERVLKAG